ncbi:MAG: hypothetical protein AMQ74_01627 [Candidatus Methanofastidiosum methylothiophilum]|uniref:Uncharacterized protein n=1 Tax=Candidatus Methanofastidiosum methylothiophilum TaxID=1705564 RepID=A0A150ITA4_9EURY|nr:MAG: hypothetical protein AMQ74_01627 [Candidatus Methanofastidiosum methylthiophilus]
MDKYKDKRKEYKKTYFKKLKQDKARELFRR